jgi:hypothetical protein
MSVNHKKNTTAPPARRDRVSSETIHHRIYVASPISTYTTARYDAMLTRVRRHFPASDILPARDLFTSNADWRRTWPVILPTLDAVVFFDDDDGCIGAGTEQEIADAQSAGIPVCFLTPPPFDRFIPCETQGETQGDDFAEVEFWPVIGGGMRQTLRVCYAIPANDVLTLSSSRGTERLGIGGA